MSKVTKRKITVESPGTKLSNSNILANKESQRRQSVFERLGTKTGTPISINTAPVGQQQSTIENFCRHWNQNGACPYGKNCVFVSTHTLISPSKRAQKKDSDPKQTLEGLKRLHSTVVKRGSPEVNWDSWDQTSLEYEDEKVLEKRRQLLQRELERQMRREEGEEHHSRHRQNPAAQKKTLSSSSSTSVSSTTSDSSSSSDDSSSDSSSTSGVAEAKRRRGKAKKSKRASTSSLSDIERKKIRESIKSMHKDRSPSNISKKSSSSRDKRAFTPPRKSAPSSKMAGRKKSLSPSHRRHNSPPPGKNKPSTSKSSSGSRHNQSPRPPSKRSTSLERKDKHRRSQSPRRGGKPGAKERSPRPPRQEMRRRKDSPSDNRARNSSHSRLPDSRLEDRKKDEDRSRNKDDRRQDRKAIPERDKRDHDDTRAREKAREAAREKEREEALERCRERQREREQLAKEKERTKTKDERDREPKKRDYDKSVPPLMALSTHGQPERKMSDRDRERGIKDRKDRDKEKEKDRDRERDRMYDRGLDKPDRNRPLEKERLSEKLSDREREKDRPRERDILNERAREKGDRDRSFERERNFDRGANESSDRTFDREKDRPSKNLDRNRERDFDKDRNYERVGDNRRSFEKADRTSLEKDRSMVRDRALDRVLEIRERNNSLERGRPSDGERNVERGRERFEREGRFDRRGLAAEDKGYESPYDSRRDRQRYGPEGSERSGMFKELSPSTREDARGLRHNQGFGEERRRGGPRGGGGWEARGGYEDQGPGKSRDWDYPESRRDWDTRNRHGDWEAGVEGDEWGRYGGPGAEWAGGEWREEWPSRPPRHGPRDDQTVVPSNHIVVRDANVEEASRRSQVLDPVEKEPLAGGDFKKDSSEPAGVEGGGGVKRLREREEGEALPEPKKPRVEEPPPLATAPLEEALSDISDDPDEILNREDVDVPAQEDGALEEEMRSSASVQPNSQELDQRLLEDRPSEEENIDNLDFEEISDEELEEEARANKGKGLGDALGVDWASLVCESRAPRPSVEAKPGAARRRWQPTAVLARIGVSLQYAGQELYDEIQQSLTTPEEGKVEEPSPGLLHPVASLHVALRERQARRKCLFTGADTFKRALSARTDISIRRQLCNLPVASLEMQQSTGFCQWVI